MKGHADGACGGKISDSRFQSGGCFGLSASDRSSCPILFPRTQPRPTPKSHLNGPPQKGRSLMKQEVVRGCVRAGLRPTAPCISPRMGCPPHGSPRMRLPERTGPSPAWWPRCPFRRIWWPTGTSTPSSPMASMSLDGGAGRYEYDGGRRLWPVSG